MRYYDTKLTPKTQKTYLDAGVNRYEETDPLVSSWFHSSTINGIEHTREFDSNGFPVLIEVVQKTQSEIDAAAFLAAKNAKKSEIRTAFNTAQLLPVVINNVSWNGGKQSALDLDSAKRLEELAGNNMVTFYDNKNVGHSLAIAEATAIILQIGGDFKAKYQHKQSLMNDVDALADTATQADIDAISAVF